MLRAVFQFTAIHQLEGWIRNMYRKEVISVVVGYVLRCRIRVKDEPATLHNTHHLSYPSPTFMFVVTGNMKPVVMDDDGCEWRAVCC